MRGFLLGVLEEAGRGDVGDVVAVEVHEGELEDETHEVVEVGLREGLGVEHFVEAAFRHAVVAGVEVEGWTAVLDDVAVDVFEPYYSYIFYFFENFFVKFCYCHHIQFYFFHNLLPNYFL